MTIRTFLVTALALAACASNSSKPTKGSTATGSAAKDAGQKAGSTAENDKSMATDDGATYENVTCDSSFEGVAWCDSDTSIVFCAGGEWWSLDCGAIGGDFCAESESTVDCYALNNN